MTRIVIVGEAWGREEAMAHRPFIGATGRELNRLCEEAGLLPPGTAKPITDALYRADYNYRDEVYNAAGIHLTNVFNFQPPGNRIDDLCGPRWGNYPPIKAGKYIREEFTPELTRLESEISSKKPNLIIGLGATALWFALGTSAISKRRGTVAPSAHGKFIATYHPAFLMRGAWNLRPVVIFDLLKAERESHYPEIRRPARFVYIPESLADIEYCLRELRTARHISIDIETTGDQITCIGFAWTTQHSLVIPIFDRSKPDLSYWPAEIETEVWRLIKTICELEAPKIFQNGLYDIHFLWRRYGIAPKNCVDDTMLLHHALQPEVQKGLGFLGSIYTDEPAWKLMRPRGKGTIKREDE